MRRFRIHAILLMLFLLSLFAPCVVGSEVSNGKVSVTWDESINRLRIETEGGPTILGTLLDEEGETIEDVAILEMVHGVSPHQNVSHIQLWASNGVRFIIDVDHSNGWQTKSPRIQFSAGFRNINDEVRVIDKYRLLRLTIDVSLFELCQLSQSQEWTNIVDFANTANESLATGFQSLGTAGLKPVDEHNGSYAFLSLVSPSTRSGLVAGWTTSHKGCGVLFSGIDEQDRPYIDVQIDYGNLRINPGDEIGSEILEFGWYDDARLGLEDYAACAARANSNAHDIDPFSEEYADWLANPLDLPPCPTGYCTWYSSPNGGACDEENIVVLAEDAAEKLGPYGFDFVQIDDKWQLGERRNGPAKLFFTHDPEGPYPNGMQGPADRIHELGMTPGIWFMPFAADRDDPFFMERPDWLVKRQDGTPYWARWGGTSLDITNPDVQEYTRSVVDRIANEWGYTYFKMDGLWVGSATELLYVNNEYKPDDIGEAVFSDPDTTNIEAYRQGLELVRDAAGPDVFFLGCNISQNMRSFAASYGLVDAMRIGPDNGSGFGSLTRGPWHGTNRYFLHGRVWHNDPDPVYVRASMPIEHARLICSWVALTGQMNAFSEWLPMLPEDRLYVLQRSMPNHGLTPRPVDLFETDLARIWLLTQEAEGDAPQRDVIGLFNWEENQPLTVDYSMERIGLDAETEYVGYDYWSDRFVRPFKGRLQCEVPPGSCSILAVRPVVDHPQLISTNRHVSQGIVDVVEETWNGDTLELSGVSKVVGDDPYELRIVAPVGSDSFRPVEVLLSQEDEAADVSIELTEVRGGRIRVMINAPENHDVQWTVRFERAEVVDLPPEPVAELSGRPTWGKIVLTWSGDGERYRITRNDGRSAEVVSGSWIDAEVDSDVEYEYSVEAIGWDGRTSESASVAIRSMKELVVPELPPAPEIDLVDLTPTTAQSGWQSVGVNVSSEGTPLTVLGQIYETGYGVHAASTLVFDVPEGVSRFVATAGLDDEEKSDDRRTVVASVYGSAKEMGEPPVLLSESPLLSNQTLQIWHFDIPLDTRTKEIRLIVDDAGDGISCDHLDWVRAGFLRE